MLITRQYRAAGSSCHGVVSAMVKLLAVLGMVRKNVSLCRGTPELRQRRVEVHVRLGLRMGRHRWQQREHGAQGGVAWQGCARLRGRPSGNFPPLGSHLGLPVSAAAACRLRVM